MCSRDRLTSFLRELNRHDLVREVLLASIPAPTFHLKALRCWSGGGFGRS
jgi:hypothetical protein